VIKIKNYPEVPILPTTVIGSYPRPKWLKETIQLAKMGKISKADLEEAFNDAVVDVMRDHQLAGIDIPTDGEMRRDEMVEFFAENLKGFTFYGFVRVWGDAYYRKPSVVSKIEYKKPMLENEVRFAQSVSYTSNLKVTITGPYTIADWSFNEYYKTKEDLVFDLAKIINQELRNLVKMGIPFVQVDEPALPTHEEEIPWAVQAINEAIKGIDVKVGLHICYGDYAKVMPFAEEMKVDQLALEFKNRDFKDLNLLKKFGYTKEIGLGVVDVHSSEVESPEEVAKGIKKALQVLEPEKIYVNPDCGLKRLSRRVAYQKLVSVVEGTKMVREELKKKGLSTIQLKPIVNR
jgi:5-methyltetrahydropteroyltriglutamate--homocysteine methyltransferase